MLDNQIDKSFKQNYQKFWQIQLIILGIVGLVSPMKTNATSVIKETTPTQSIPSTAISVDFLDLFRNAVRFVQVSNISDEEEVEIGKQINQQLLNRQYQLANNSQLQQYVDNIGQELVAKSDSRDIPFTFQAVKSDAVNAFATPGGFIYVTTGLVEEADNQAQLASVIAHEIGHINKRHSIKALKQSVLAQHKTLD